jgi:hypothetical protein
MKEKKNILKKQLTDEELLQISGGAGNSAVNCPSFTTKNQCEDYKIYCTWNEKKNVCDKKLWLIFTKL